MENISITETESLFVENFFKFFTSRDVMMSNTVVYQNFCLCLPIKEVNAETRDKTNGSSSGDVTFGILKQLRNSIKSGLTTSSSSNCDILGGQETGSFPFTFPTNV